MSVHFPAEARRAANYQLPVDSSIRRSTGHLGAAQSLHSPMLPSFYLVWSIPLHFHLDNTFYYELPCVLGKRGQESNMACFTSRVTLLSFISVTTKKLSCHLQSAFVQAFFHPAITM